MLGFAGSIGIPLNLAVHVGVMVNKSRSDDKSIDVYCLCGTHVFAPAQRRMNARSSLCSTWVP